MDSVKENTKLANEEVYTTKTIFYANRNKLEKSIRSKELPVISTDFNPIFRLLYKLILRFIFKKNIRKMDFCVCFIP